MSVPEGLFEQLELRVREGGPIAALLAARVVIHGRARVVLGEVAASAAARVARARRLALALSVGARRQVRVGRREQAGGGRVLVGERVHLQRVHRREAVASARVGAREGGRVDHLRADLLSSACEFARG